MTDNTQVQDDPMAENNHSGAMVAYYPPLQVAETLSKEVSQGAIVSLAASEMHLTLVFLGDSADLTDKSDVLTRKIRGIARGTAPFKAQINGTGRFFVSGTDGKHVVYANVDSPGLASFRSQVLSVVASAGVSLPKEHGFTPHITLAYIDADAPMPNVTFPLIDIMISTVSLAIGSDVTSFQLRMSPSSKKTVLPERMGSKASSDAKPVPSDVINADLYRTCLKQAKSRSTSWPSAWGSGYLVALYEERGGKYKPKGKS